VDWLNYHHLLYFWMAAREGSISKAAQTLRLAQPTLSGQIKQLEDRLGQPLFAKAGRGLRLTEFGELVLDYADQIFGLGQELLRTVETGLPGRRSRLVVGVADVIPKLIIKRLLEPALAMSDQIRLIIDEAPVEELVAALATHSVDVVVADEALGSGSPVRAFNHPLGASRVAWFGDRRTAERLRRGFPRTLHGAPVLLPSEGTALRRSIDEWLAQHEVTPQVVAEVEDSALLKTLGSEGVGVFAAPTVIAQDIQERYGAVRFGDAVGIVERYFAISAERRVRNPAVLAICAAARVDVFGSDD